MSKEKFQITIELVGNSGYSQAYMMCELKELFRKFTGDSKSINEVNVLSEPLARLVENT
jgi:hypothetical protein